MEIFFDIIPKLPGVRVFYLPNDPTTAQKLSEYCNQLGHYLEIVALDDNIHQKIKDLPAKIRRIEESKERYNQRSWQYDTIFVEYDISKIKNKEQFFRKIYRIMKNAADLVVKVDPKELAELETLLQDLNYVAINPIETEGIVALSAKKMHGWTKV